MAIEADGYMSWAVRLTEHCFQCPTSKSKRTVIKNHQRYLETFVGELYGCILKSQNEIGEFGIYFRVLVARVTFNIFECLSKLDDTRSDSDNLLKLIFIIRKDSSKYVRRVLLECIFEFLHSSDIKGIIIFTKIKCQTTMYFDVFTEWRNAINLGRKLTLKLTLKN